MPAIRRSNPLLRRARLYSILRRPGDPKVGKGALRAVPAILTERLRAMPGTLYEGESAWPGLLPAIHVFLACCRKDVDARLKAGHDEKSQWWARCRTRSRPAALPTLQAELSSPRRSSRPGRSFPAADRIALRLPAAGRCDQAS